MFHQNPVYPIMEIELSIYDCGKDMYFCQMQIFKGLFKKNNSKADFSALGTDMHSHLIPAVDDGSESIDDSIRFIESLILLGYRKIITTPHIMGDFYKNTPEIIHSGLDSLRRALLEKGIEIPIEAAAEYYLDYEFTQKIKSEKLLTFGKNYLLFEISYMNLPENLSETIFQLQLAGYKPVLAHPERYPFWWNKFNEYEKLKEAGVLFQINLNSLTGYYSAGAKQTAEKLIEMDMVEFAGTDLHHNKHLDSLRSAGMKDHFGKLIASGKLLNPFL